MIEFDSMESNCLSGLACNSEHPYSTSKYYLATKCLLNIYFIPFLVFILPDYPIFSGDELIYLFSFF